MLFYLISSFTTVVIFGMLVIYFSRREQKIRKEYLLQTEVERKLKNLIKTEEGKLISMITSLADGILMVDNNNVLSIINESAKKLLGITGDTPSLLDVASSFPRTFELSSKISQVLKENKRIDEKEVNVEKKIVHISMTPVPGVQDNEIHSVIGVAIVLQDMTLEKELSKLKEDFTSTVVHEVRSPLTA